MWGETCLDPAVVQPLHHFSNSSVTVSEAVGPSRDSLLVSGSNDYHRQCYSRRTRDG
jgi:hypothetical protein